VAASNCEKRISIEAAASGQAAIDLLRSGVPSNLVLSNLLLPEVDGYSLLLHVKKHYPRIPFVLVTAIRDARIREEVMRNGAENFLLKRFGQEDCGQWSDER
jgi:DNA-binding NarL/FixJ family response regulator